MSLRSQLLQHKHQRLSWPAVEFEIRHRFPAEFETVAAALLDRGYQDSLGDIGQLTERRVLSQQEQPDGKVVRRIRCVLGIDLGAARRFVGDAEPAWVEEAVWHPDRGRWDWRVHPEVAAELLSAAGAIELAAAGDHTSRRVVGDVRVKVPIYGGRVEGWIVDGLVRAYEEEADRLRQWLEGRS
jgi:hypothetical protein